MRYKVIRDFTGPEGRDGRARCGDFVDVNDEVRAKDLIRWGLLLPEDAIPKPLAGAGQAPASESSPVVPGRATHTAAIASSPSTTRGASSPASPTSSTRATGSGGTSTTKSPKGGSGGRRTRSPRGATA